MGKPNGGIRPIALMPMLYRLWTKIRKVNIGQWESVHGGPWDAALKGSSALRAAVYGTFFDELCSEEDRYIASILYDMEKFYDNISIPKLLGEAEQLDYPAHAMSMGIQMHMAPRLIKARDCYCYAPLPSNGIIAGCTQSNSFARVLLHRLMDTANYQQCID